MVPVQENELVHLAVLALDWDGLEFPRIWLESLAWTEANLCQHPFT
jgi:hypothetical protein